MYENMSEGDCVWTGGGCGLAGALTWVRRVWG